MNFTFSMFLASVLSLTAATPALPNLPLPNAPLPNVPLPNAPLPNVPIPNAPLPNPPVPVASLGIPGLPAGVPSVSTAGLPAPSVGATNVPNLTALGVPAPATSILSAAAASSGLPSLTNIPPVAGAPVPPGLATVPVLGLTTDALTLANKVSEGIQVLQLVINILGQLAVAGAIAVPGALSLSEAIEGTLIVQLLALAKSTVPSS